MSDLQTLQVHCCYLLVLLYHDIVHLQQLFWSNSVQLIQAKQLFEKKSDAFVEVFSQNSWLGSIRSTWMSF